VAIKPHAAPPPALFNPVKQAANERVKEGMDRGILYHKTGKSKKEKPCPMMQISCPV